MIEKLSRLSRTHFASSLLASQLLLLVGCTNGNFTSDKMSSTLGNSSLSNPTSGSGGSMAITGQILGSFEDVVGPGKIGIFANIGKPLETLLTSQQMDLSNFLNMARNDASFGAQTLTVAFTGTVNVKAYIPLSRLVVSLTESTLGLANGLIIRGDGRAALTHYDPSYFPTGAAGLSVYWPNQSLTVFGGNLDGVYSDRVLSFSLAGGMGTLLTNELYFPPPTYGAPNETLVYPASGISSGSGIYPIPTRKITDLRNDFRALHRNSATCSLSNQAQWAGNATLVYPLHNDLYAVYVISRKSPCTGNPCYPWQVSICGYASGTYHCYPYYTLAFPSSYPITCYNNADGSVLWTRSSWSWDSDKGSILTSFTTADVVPLPLPPLSSIPANTTNGIRVGF